VKVDNEITQFAEPRVNFTDTPTEDRQAD